MAANSYTLEAAANANSFSVRAAELRSNQPKEIRIPVRAEVRDCPNAIAASELSEEDQIALAIQNSLNECQAAMPSTSSVRSSVLVSSERNSGSSTDEFDIASPPYTEHSRNENKRNKTTKNATNTSMDVIYVNEDSEISDNDNESNSERSRSGDTSAIQRPVAAIGGRSTKRYNRTEQPGVSGAGDDRPYDDDQPAAMDDDDTIEVREVDRIQDFPRAKETSAAGSTGARAKYAAKDIHGFQASLPNDSPYLQRRETLRNSKFQSQTKCTKEISATRDQSPQKFDQIRHPNRAKDLSQQKMEENFNCIKEASGLMATKCEKICHMDCTKAHEICHHNCLKTTSGARDSKCLQKFKEFSQNNKDTWSIKDNGNTKDTWNINICSEHVPKNNTIHHHCSCYVGARETTDVQDVPFAQDFSNSVNGCIQESLTPQDLLAEDVRTVCNQHSHPTVMTRLTVAKHLAVSDPALQEPIKEHLNRTDHLIQDYLNTTEGCPRKKKRSTTCTQTTDSIQKLMAMETADLAQTFIPTVANPDQKQENQSTTVQLSSAQTKAVTVAAADKKLKPIVNQPIALQPLKAGCSLTSEETIIVDHPQSLAPSRNILQTSMMYQPSVPASSMLYPTSAECRYPIPQTIADRSAHSQSIVPAQEQTEFQDQMVSFKGNNSLSEKNAKATSLNQAEYGIETKIQLRLPNGERRQTNWPPSTKLKAIKLHLENVYPDVTNQPYKLIAAFPRQNILDLEENLTLIDAKLHPSSILHLHPDN